MKKLITLTALLIVSASTQLFAGNNGRIEVLPLVCIQDIGSNNSIIWSVVIEPEIVNCIPESNCPVRYTGQYTAVVRDASQPMNLGTIVYTGDGSFQFFQNGPNSYHFESKTLGINVNNCEVDTVANGTGGMSISN